MSSRFLSTLTRAEFTKLLQQFNATPDESIAFSESLDRILAADLTACEDLPAGDRSCMDGYALAAADTFGAGEGNPAYLECRHCIEVNVFPNFSLQPGECAWIPTGGFLPPGADSVVMVEYTHDIGDGTIEVRRSLAPGENLMFRGEDARKGSPLLKRGTRLRVPEMGLLAALGLTQIRVHRRPRVAILSTGDEIVPVEAQPRPGEMRDVNSHAVAAMVMQAGGVVEPLGIVRDDLEALRDALERGLKNSDALLLSGGSSKGTRDHTLDAIAQLPGAQILAHGVAMAPGKPTILARVGAKPILGLPGQVGSAQIVMLVLGQPLVRHLAGDGRAFDESRRSLRRALLTRNVPSSQGREDYLRVRLEETADGLLAHPVMGKSGLLRTLLHSDALLVISAETEGLLEGRPVDVWLI
ncbi:molybdopterin molybdotransferase [Geoalkalibacter ferrihydriticus]|uniref:Molybdopterin molybdenumtransferase n=2 Tax=Geoalkalibacter ferrihydriticus TaxID=392333 RepID=A0A0C2HTP6_9BACT|nr:gephyrin-like molybdotransferase Glp [Geoalkalibacter ferrihydriticus]KIH78160.1 molybdopterin biosynthesis protein MoeA [Geoalkalibacter ferrihydriticus DSM 17813]SDM19894.1 molybdopterin molybdotransferase [Geoalkalibacter ferrihydriticus]